MRRLLMLLMLLPVLIQTASALELEAPRVPDSGAEWMPEDTDNFSEALTELLRKAVRGLRPDLTEATHTAAGVLSAAVIVSLLQSLSAGTGKLTVLTGIAVTAALLLKSTNALICLAADTVVELSEYGRLLLPVMTAALAAQGGTATSGALYAGTAAFDLLLTALIAKLLVPGVYFYLAMAVAAGAIGDDLLKRLRDLVKNCVSWTLKTVLTVYTTYMSITGVVSGTTDAAALKAAKFTISNAVPVVGGILSDASEAVLISGALVKNAAGIYGILAMLAVFASPFLKIGLHYLVLKLTAALSGLVGPKAVAELVDSFSTAMGLLLAMTGAVCLLLLISTVCFLRGVG